jgi:hypothetical protein
VCVGGRVRDRATVVQRKTGVLGPYAYRRAIHPSELRPICCCVTS